MVRAPKAPCCSHSLCKGYLPKLVRTDQLLHAAGKWEWERNGSITSRHRPSSLPPGASSLREMVQLPLSPFLPKMGKSVVHAQSESSFPDESDPLTAHLGF